MRPSVPDVHISDSQDAELAAYRSISGLAIIGLILGLLAPLAMVDPVLWLLPIPGVIVNWMALRRIRFAGPSMMGRKIAILGAAISLAFLAAAPAEWFVYRKIVRDEARQFADMWFRYLAHDEPQMAYQLTIAPRSRQPLNDQLLSYYQSNRDLSQQLESYANGSPVRSLLALGPRAQVRFYQTIDQTRGEALDQIAVCYAVTYDEQGEKTSFFVLLQLIHGVLPDGRADWRILQAQGGFRPEGW